MRQMGLRCSKHIAHGEAQECTIGGLSHRLEQQVTLPTHADLPLLHCVLQSRCLALSFSGASQISHPSR